MSRPRSFAHASRIHGPSRRVQGSAIRGDTSASPRGAKGGALSHLRTMDDRDFLRHALATIAYRGGKTFRGAPNGFGSTSAGRGSRTAVEILAHIGDLFDWMLGLADGEHRWGDTATDDWAGQVDRFYAGLAALDARLCSPEPLGKSPAKLFQGPVADTLQHVGQLAMLRRLAGSPVKGENFYKADIQIGRVGPD